MIDCIFAENETDNLIDAYRSISQAEIDAALRRVSAYVEAIGAEPVPAETSRRIWDKINDRKDDSAAA